MAFAFAGECLRPIGYVGAVLMLFSLVLMEMDWNALKGKRQKTK